MDINTKECNSEYDTTKVANECKCEQNCGCLGGGTCLCYEGRCKCYEKCKCETVKVKCVNA